jgi:hypothetical protein
VERGCEWEGTVGTLEQHVAKCGFTLVPCPNKCRNSFMRRDLDRHLRKGCPNRDHSCQYCGKKGTYAEITELHDDKCEKKIVPCISDGCTETMERQNINEHVHTECPHTVISCKYKGIGCTSQLKRKDMPAHEEDDKLHLHMALDTVTMLQTVTFKDDNSESLTFAVPDYQKMKKDGATFTSPSFYTHPNGYLMEVAVRSQIVRGRFSLFARIKDLHSQSGVVASIRVLKGNCDAKLNWPFRGKVEIELLNQLADRGHLRETEEVVLCRGEKTACISITDSRLDHDRAINTQYLMDDTLYFRVSLKVESNGPKPRLKCTAK